MQKLKYIQVQVHTVMNFKDPDDGVPVYDEKSNYAGSDTTESIGTKPKSASQTGAPSRPRQPRREANPTRAPERAAEPRRAHPAALCKIVSKKVWHNFAEMLRSERCKSM